MDHSKHFRVLTEIMGGAVSQKKKSRLRKSKTLKLKNKKKSTKTNTMSSQSNLILLNAFKRDGISVLDAMTESELAQLITFCNDYYYTLEFGSEPLITDNQYDIIKEYLERKNPQHPVLEKVGAPEETTTESKVKLPYFLGSMDKIKPDTNALPKWLAKYKGPYTVSYKLDGMSALYSTMNPKNPVLFTRGDGTWGQNISHLIPFLNLPADPYLAVRGELIIPVVVFKNKYAQQYANPRNLVVGICKSGTGAEKKGPDERIYDVQFVAYESMEPPMLFSDQMTNLTQHGFNTVHHTLLRDISNESLSTILKKWRYESPYEIDGIIVECNARIYPRTTDKYPKYAFAFKMLLSEQIAEAKVVDVVWAISKDGYLKPRVRIEPVHLMGVTIEWATGFNAQFIESHQIGIGAVVEISRSNDVIPHILSVTTPAVQAKMPTVAFHWNETRVDIISDNMETDFEWILANNVYFMKHMKIDALSEGNLRRIMATQFVSIPQIIRMTVSDLLTVEGFKTTMANKVFKNIQTRIKEATVVEWMVASNKLGRGLGEKKMQLILDAYPNIMTDVIDVTHQIERLVQIDGIGEKNARIFAENLDGFLAFMQECQWVAPAKKRISLVVNKALASHVLTGKTITMSKVRDADILNNLKEVGAKFSDTINKTTFALVVKSKADQSNKIKFAQEHNIPIFEPAEFLTVYFPEAAA
jgi:NAD-dependent DNA ligase